MGPFGWITTQVNDYLILVLPMHDSKEHDQRSARCSCRPKVFLENGSTVIVHNAFDGRHMVEERSRMVQ